MLIMDTTLHFVIVMSVDNFVYLVYEIYPTLFKLAARGPSPPWRRCAYIHNQQRGRPSSDPSFGLATGFDDHKREGFFGHEITFDMHEAWMFDISCVLSY